MNNKKICFVICYNQEVYLNECLLYLHQLHIPDGYSMDILTILDAPSMTMGYQAAMEESDAKYKIYIHQDVFILYRYFLDSIIQIFESYHRIGMIGMAGTALLSEDYIMSNSEKYIVNLYQKEGRYTDYKNYRYDLAHGLSVMDAIDGLLMATAYDIPWRTDILDGWDFYDISQSFEFRRKGYKIVVPKQHYPWCLHDDGNACDYWDYNRSRHICMKEYPLSLFPPGSH